MDRSPAVVIAYLMKYKQWRLPQAYQWVKDRRPSINLTEGTGVEHDALADVGCGSCGVVMRLSQLMVWSSETLLLRANRNVRGLVMLWRCVFMV